MTTLRTSRTRKARCEEAQRKHKRNLYVGGREMACMAWSDIGQISGVHGWCGRDVQRISVCSEFCLLLSLLKVVTNLMLGAILCYYKQMWFSACRFVVVWDLRMFPGVDVSAQPKVLAVWRFLSALFREIQHVLWGWHLKVWAAELPCRLGIQFVWVHPV